MKNILQKTSLFIFTITFFVIMGIPIHAINLPNDYSNKQNFILESHNAYKEKFGDNYAQQFKKNETATQNAEKIQDTFDKDDNGEIVYPDYIGGIYINDNDDLVVQLVEGNTQKMKLTDLNRYNKIMAVDTETKYEQVTYSYNELEEIRKSIEKEFADGKLKGIVNMLYLDIINNSVVVSLKEYNEENIKLVKDTVSNENALTFYNEVEITTSASEKKQVLRF